MASVAVNGYSLLCITTVLLCFNVYLCVDCCVCVRVCIMYVCASDCCSYFVLLHFNSNKVYYNGEVSGRFTIFQVGLA